MIYKYIKQNQLSKNYSSGLKRKIFLLSLAVLITALPLAYLTLRHSSPAEAAWFNDSWLYRKAVAIPSHTSAENNVYVTAPTFDATDTTKFQSDCGDLRFTKQNGELLPYYVVDCDATANIHVQFDTLPAGASTYYMYYGNPSAQNGFESADFATAASGLGTQTLASEEQSVGPVAYWKFDEGSGITANDSTTNRNAGTLTNMSATPATNSGWLAEDACVSGKCLGFDGWNDIITVPNSNSLKFSNSNRVTFESWIKIPSLPSSDRVIVRKWSSGQEDVSLRISSSGKVQFIAYNVGTTYWVTSSSTVSLNSWTHVAGSYDGSYLNVYINGKLDNKYAATGNILSSTQILTIGHDRVNNSPLNGFLDEVKIYNYARSAQQILADFNSRSTQKGASAKIGPESAWITNGLVGHWKMDEATWSGTLTDALDSSGNGNNGQAAGATGGKAYPSSGKFGNGGYFDGVDDYVNVTDANSLDLSQFAVSFWVKTPSRSSGSWMAVVVKGITSNENYGVYFGDNTTLSRDKIRFQFTHGGSYTASSVDSVGVFADNTWHHFLGTFNGSVMKIYKDGILDNSSSNTNTPDQNANNLTIGQRSSILYYIGSLDDLRIYNRALSAKEVRDLYNWAPPPVALWSFEEGQGTSVSDKSGNGNTGTWAGTGTTHWTAGKFGKAGKFNGSDDYVNIGTGLNSNFVRSKAFSMEGWIKTSTSASADIISSADWQSPYVGVEFLVQSTGELKFDLVQTGSKLIRKTTSATVRDGNWHHVAFTYNGNGTASGVTLYIDGSSATATTSYDTMDGDAISSTNLQIGARDGTNVPFGGQIDEVKIYNYARTQKQIVEDMQAGEPAVAASGKNAVAYYKFDEGYGTTAHNAGSCGTACDGTFGATTAAPTWNNNGKFGKALQFDGSNDYASVTNGSSLFSGKSEVTVSFWVKPQGGSNLKSIINIPTGSGGTFSIENNSAASPAKIYFNNNNAVDIPVTQNEWAHIVAIFNNGSVKGYKNGRLIDTKTNTSTTINTVSGNLEFGRMTWVSGFTNMSLDEVKIYNYALTEDEVKTEYNRGSAVVLGTLSNTSGLSGGSVASSSASAAYCIPGDTATCNPPVGEWKFEEGSGGTVNDSSGNSNTLTTVNNPSWKTGKYGKTLEFNNTNQGSYTSSNVTTATNNWTMGAWVYLKNTASNTQSIFYNGNSGSSGYGLFLIPSQCTGSNLSLLYGGLLYNCTTISLSNNTWTYLVATRDNGTLKLYKNGQLAYTGVTSAPNTPTNYTYVGGDNAGGGSFNGSIDHVRIYNYARSPAQIAWDYNRGKPVGWWKMDECSGTALKDSISATNSATLSIGLSGTQTGTGTCTDGSSASAWYNGATGKYNSSVKFDGTDDYASVTTGLNYVQSVAFWVKPTSSTTSMLQLNTGSYISATSGTISATGFTSPTIYVNGTPSTALTASAWNHIVITTGTGISASAIKFGLVGSTYFSGQIDEVQIFNYALTSVQVEQLFNQGSAVRFGPETGNP